MGKSTDYSRRKLFWRVVPGVLGVVLLMGGVLAAPASAAPDKATDRLLSSSGEMRALAAPMYANRATGLCLDSNFQGHVYTLACNGGNYQRWDYIFGILVNVATGRCLDSNFQGHVYTLACNGGAYQAWGSSNNTDIVNGATLRCLDSNFQGHVYTLACNGGNYQKWYVR